MYPATQATRISTNNLANNCPQSFLETSLRVGANLAELQLVLNSLISSVFSIANVFLVLVICFFIFGILGVQLFKGKMYKCVLDRSNEEIDFLTQHINNDVYNTTAFREWCAP